MKRRTHFIATFLLALVSSVAACAEYSPGVIIAEDTKGYLSPNEHAKPGWKFKKMERVSLKVNSGPSKFFLVEGMDEKQAGPLVGAVPDTWVASEKATFVHAMQPWRGCWPVKEIVFEDGTLDIRVVFDQNGKGKISYTEGPQNSRAKVFWAGDVIDIRDLDEGASHFFTLPSPGKPHLFSLEYDIRKVLFKNCNTANRTN